MCIELGKTFVHVMFPPFLAAASAAAALDLAFKVTEPDPD